MNRWFVYILPLISINRSLYFSIDVFCLSLFLFEQFKIEVNSGGSNFLELFSSTLFLILLGTCILNFRQIEKCYWSGYQLLVTVGVWRIFNWFVLTEVHYISICISIDTQSQEKQKERQNKFMHADIWNLMHAYENVSEILREYTNQLQLIKCANQWKRGTKKG